MKSILPNFLCLFILPTALQTQAQVKFPVTDNDLRNNLEKIIEGFPQQFSNLKGAVIEENPQTVEYASLLQFKGAMENSFTRYKSVKPIYSWQAMLLSSEEFDEAAKKYKWLCKQLSVMTVNVEGYSFTMSGKYEEASESKNFTTTIFKLTPNAINMPKIKIEASLQFEFPEWKTMLLVYEKEKEDKERGAIREQ